MTYSIDGPGWSAGVGAGHPVGVVFVDPTIVECLIRD